MTPTEKQQVRRAITDYCVASEIHTAAIHYSQARPMTHLGKDPRNGFTADCSGHATGCFYWAQQQTGIHVEDPNGRHYNGSGYTGTLLATNRAHPVPSGHVYLVGDLALYGPSLLNTKHVVTCRTRGTALTSVWTSHGSERAPYPVRLRYRSDLLTVLRPRALL